MPSYTVTPGSAPSTASTSAPYKPDLSGEVPLEPWARSTALWVDERKRILQRAREGGWNVEKGAVEIGLNWGHTDAFQHIK